MRVDKKKANFWKDTGTWRVEPDFWRKGIMKKLPVLSSLSFVLFLGELMFPDGKFSNAFPTEV